MSRAVISRRNLAGAVVTSLLLSALSLSGCGHLQTPDPDEFSHDNWEYTEAASPVVIAPEYRYQQTWQPLPPTSFGSTLFAQQQLTTEFGEQSHSLQLVLEIAPEAFNLVALSGMGQRLITVQYLNGQYQFEKSKFIPDQWSPLYLLTDLQLALWPDATLQQHLLNTPYQLESAGPARELRYRDDNTLLVAIQYYPNEQQWQRVTITNPVQQYRIQVTNLTAL